MLDYYKILNVEKGVNDEELRVAYRKLAMKWHPDNNPDDVDVAKEKFQEVGEAYHVLSDPGRRADHDRSLGRKRTAFDFAESSAGEGIFEFRYDDASNLFSSMFTSTLFGLYGENSVLLNAINRDPLRGRGARHQPAPSPENPPGAKRKADEIVRDLNVSLEDMYCGKMRRLRSSRRVIDQETGVDGVQQIIMEVDIKPGWKTGTKVTFPNHGDDDPGGCEAADLTFVIKAQPHPIFNRVGDDLTCKICISLACALTNPTIPITTLDGRVLSIYIDEIITPGFRWTVKGEGMPFPRDPRQHGDLHLDFTVIFPSSLSPSQKAAIVQILP